MNLIVITSFLLLILIIYYITYDSNIIDNTNLNENNQLISKRNVVFADEVNKPLITIIKI